MTVDPIQERPGQVVSDDFIGCMHGVSINGRPLNLSGPIQVILMFLQLFINNHFLFFCRVCNKYIFIRRHEE